MQQAGIDQEQIVLLVEDHHLVLPEMAEMLNSLLASGEVPGLYTPEELDPLMAPLREQASQDAHHGAIYTYFAKRKYPQPCQFV